MDQEELRTRLIRLWAQAINKRLLAQTDEEQGRAEAYELGVADSFREAFSAVDVLDGRPEAEELARSWREKTASN